MSTFYITMWILLSSLNNPRDPLGFYISTIDSVLVCSPIRSLYWLSVSTYLFSLPRVYIILNLYCPNISNYLAYYGVNSFIIIKRKRFL